MSDVTEKLREQVKELERSQKVMAKALEAERALRREAEGRSTASPAPMIATQELALPKPGGTPVFPEVFALVQQMLKAREAKGIQLYGQSLLTHDGRPAFTDAMQEKLDDIAYTMKLEMERRVAVVALEDILGLDDVMPPMRGASRDARIREICRRGLGHGGP